MKPSTRLCTGCLRPLPAQGDRLCAACRYRHSTSAPERYVSPEAQALLAELEAASRERRQRAPSSLKRVEW